MGTATCAAGDIVRTSRDDEPMTHELVVSTIYGYAFGINGPISPVEVMKNGFTKTVPLSTFPEGTFRSLALSNRLMDSFGYPVSPMSTQTDGINVLVAHQQMTQAQVALAMSMSDLGIRVFTWDKDANLTPIEEFTMSGGSYTVWGRNKQFSRSGDLEAFVA
jgi:hypothetical protein